MDLGGCKKGSSHQNARINLAAFDGCTKKQLANLLDFCTRFGDAGRQLIQNLAGTAKEKLVKEHQIKKLPSWLPQSLFSMLLLLP